MDDLGNKPKVSVVIPTYNRAHILGRAIKSVLDQTFKDFELIIVDDGSTDGTVEVVASVNDPRIRYIRHDSNRGANAARNTGIKAACAEYMAFQDSDDEWLPEKLEKQVGILEAMDHEVAVVYTGFFRLKGDEVIYIPGNDISKKEGHIHRQLLEGNFITTQAVLARRQCIIDCGMFDEEMPRFQDWDLWIRMARKYRFSYINEPLARVYHTLDSISENAAAYDAAIGRIIDKYRDDFLGYPNIGSRILRFYALIKINGGEVALARKYLWESFFAKPNIKSLVLLGASLFGSKVYLKLWRTWLRWNNIPAHTLPAGSKEDFSNGKTG